MIKRITEAGTITQTLTVDKEITIATLPEEFRPVQNINKYITYRLDSTKTIIASHGQLVINTDGTVKFSPAEVPSTGGVFRIDETYI